MNYVALVPARGGSKGILKKNIKPLCGMPLIYWVCKAAQDCPMIDAVYVATDDPEIAAAARGLGLSKVREIGRAPETATDTASTESLMLDFAGRVDFENLVLLQATSPLLRGVDLEAGCRAFEKGDCDSVLSVVRQTRFQWREEADGLAAPVNYDFRQRPRRQDFEGFLVENGAFYITRRGALLEAQCRLSGRVRMVEMPEDTYFELDEPEDWIIIEGVMRKRFQAERAPLIQRLRKIRLVATDVDGCLTDSGMYYGEGGDELKRFSARDGQGFNLLRDAGLTTAIITQEKTELVLRRAAKLQVEEVHLNARNKVAVMEELLARHQLGWEEVAYLGDDLGDAALLGRVAVSACPADAMAEIRRIAELQLETPGGQGAFREFAELILAAQRGV